MAAPLKKRALKGKENPMEGGSESDSGSESDKSDLQESFDQENIIVDFEGRNPVDSDFNGIKLLLKQLFLKAHVNLTELTDLIIAQNYVGSVVKQSEDVEFESDEEDDSNDVFGITTVINLADKQNFECIQQLRSLLVELSSEYATDQANTLIRSLLANESKPVGLLVNERFINIPMQIAVPLLESLSKEVDRAVQKKMPFDFGYYILISKIYKTDGSVRKVRNKNKKKNGNSEEFDILWSNPEEELIDQIADCRFEFSVKDESDSGLSGNWLEGDEAMVPYRRVLLFQADKLESIVDRIKAYVAQ